MSISALCAINGGGDMVIDKNSSNTFGSYELPTSYSAGCNGVFVQWELKTEKGVTLGKIELKYLYPSDFTVNVNTNEGSPYKIYGTPRNSKEDIQGISVLE